MKQLNKAAWRVLLDQKEDLSVLTALDLALLANKKIIFKVSINEYIEIIAAFGFVLDFSNVLVIPHSSFSADIEGFSSIGERLMEKLSYVASTKFKNINIIVVIDNVEVFECYDIVNSLSVNAKTEYNKIIENLKLSQFEKVDQVDAPRQFCVKGGIIDVYSPLYSRPIRLYLYDNDTSCQFYDIGTGLTSSEGLENIVLTKQTKIKRKIPVESLVGRGFLLFDKPFVSQTPSKSAFSPLGPSDVFKKTKHTHYLTNLYFSAYSYKDLTIAPNHYNNRLELSPQQEDVALQKGDFVCHEEFGVGVLLDLASDPEGPGEEFLKIKYADAVVHLSINNLNKLSFVSRETEDNIKISALSKKGVWLKRKSAAQEVIKEQVEHLVIFYSNKKNTYRKPYVFGGEIEANFLSNFEYQDTPDQVVAWQDIVKDLEENFPMYRLLCGDVGFGKTEIAMRAAFRVLINNGQVLVLAPTSVLASQHFYVFMDRMKRDGVKIGLMTRLNTLKEKAQIKNRWVRGDLDILIGTHAVLYDPVFIKHTNLFIVDEEHRFGVKDKEGILEGFVNKDVLLMSATPIPRSLNLSLSGLSDISTLGTPPVLRRPIQTFVNYFEDSLIMRAIEFEISRSGQVFFVHNNIASIQSIKSFLVRLCPGVRVLVAHSKVSPKKLKEHLFSFINKEADILLCTSIIGSGIDIPNANTIIVNSAHRFGLGQLHQIRGRVGRSNKQGFAYLLLPKGARLTGASQKRLKAIEQNVSLGSGYHIAKSDLKIRGGGALFGYKQSGKAFDFGFEFYSKIAAKVLRDFSGFSDSFYVDNFVYNVDFLCCFPQQYVESSFSRLRYYRVLNGLYFKSKINSFRSNLKDKYGPLPNSANNIINMRLITLVACKLKITTLVSKEGFVNFVFNNTFKQSNVLFKFLKCRVGFFGVKRYDFEVLEHTTGLCLEFKKTTKVTSQVILDLLKELYVVYKKN